MYFPSVSASESASQYLSLYTGGKQRSRELAIEHRDLLCVSLSLNAQRLLGTPQYKAFPNATDDSVDISGVPQGVSPVEKLLPTRMFEAFQSRGPNINTLEIEVKNMSPSERMLVRDFFLGPLGAHADQMINLAYIEADKEGMASAEALSSYVQILNIFALYHDLGLMAMSPIEFLLFCIHQRTRDTIWDVNDKRWGARSLIMNLCLYIRRVLPTSCSTGLGNFSLLVMI